MPKVSVIVPIYNVARYIEKCVRSLFEQTIDDIEYIFVNDCTPDASMVILSEILKEYPNRSNQVIIINQPRNLGAAQARKAGVEKATGQYIIHCDSDDWVERDMYKAMYEKAVTNSYDYLICESIIKWTNKEDVKLIKFNVPTSKQILISAMLNGSTTVALYMSMAKRDLYMSAGFVFPTNHMREDLAYSIQLAYFAQSVGKIEHPYYHYRQHDGSICADSSESGLVKKFLQTKANIELVENFLSDKNICIYNTEIHHVRLVALGLLVPLFKRNNKYRRLWLDTYPATLYWMLFSYKCDYPLTLRIIYLLVSIGIYPWVSGLQLRLKELQL